VAANAATSVNTANTIVKRDGSGNFSAGAITATSLSGNGASLTSLNAGNLASGTVPVARLSGVASNQLDAGTWFAATNLSGSINATNIASGTVPLGRLSGITSNQLDAGTWQFLVALASGIPAGMVLIPAGSFTMGDTLDGDANAIPTNVYVSAFYMDTNLVSWSQWQGVYAYATNHGYGLNTGAGKAANHPVQMVGWYDCVKWCNARSQQAGKVPVYYTDAGLTKVYTNGEVTVYVNWGAKGYRLPTEAEWEKAARGGLSGQRFPWGNLISQTNANYLGATGSYSYDLGPNGYNSIGSIGGTSPATSPVGSFAANGYGLYDMAGNVWQWCWDWYGTPYDGGTDPRGAASGSYRVDRGGSWNGDAFYCRAADRDGYIPTYRDYDLGFRSVLPPGQ
jgi:formylglycine-generating enzyme required for sulfatase activity